MKRLLFTLTLTLSCTTLFSQMILSAGYTSASIRFHDLEFFGDSVYFKNGGQQLEIPQQQRGFNAGLAFQAMEGGGPYIRGGFNFSKHGQKTLTLTDGSTIRLKGSATDVYLTGGVMFGDDAGGALYVIVGATYTTGHLDLVGSWGGYEGEYIGHQLKMSYGLGTGFFFDSGLGLSLDLYCNFSKKNTENLFHKGDVFLPLDFATHQSNPNQYQGAFVTATNGYIRGQVTLHIPISDK